MNLMFLGPPGAGKGTVASRLAEDKDIPHISTGDIFRAAIRDETDLGKKVKAILDRGDLVPDELTVSLVRERLSRPDAEKGYILDGFPRTIGQADALAEFSSLDKVLNFQIPDSEVVKRLSGRRIHKPSGRTYHIEFNPPKVAGKDDATGEDLIQRPDDTEEAIKNRLEVYKKQTAPLIEYYEKKDLLINVDATGSPDEVYGTVLEIVQ